MLSVNSRSLSFDTNAKTLIQLYPVRTSNDTRKSEKVNFGEVIKR